MSKSISAKAMSDVLELFSVYMDKYGQKLLKSQSFFKKNDKLRLAVFSHRN